MCFLGLFCQFDLLSVCFVPLENAQNPLIGLFGLLFLLFVFSFGHFLLELGESVRVFFVGAVPVYSPEFVLEETFSFFYYSQFELVL